MKKPSILVLILSLILGVVYLTIIRFQNRNPFDDSAHDQLVQDSDSVANGDMDSLKQFVDEFYDLIPGHYSSENGMEFLAEIGRNNALSKNLAEQLQNDPSIAKSLLGLFIQLEVNGLPRNPANMLSHRNQYCLDLQRPSGYSFTNSSMRGPSSLILFPPV